MPILQGLKFLFLFLLRKTLSASFRLENLTMILFFLSEGSGWHDSRQPWFTFIPVTFPIYPHTFLSLVESEIPKIFTNSRREYCSFLQNCFSKLVMHFSWVLFIASEISNWDSILSKVLLTSTSWFVMLSRLLFSLSSFSAKIDISSSLLNFSSAALFRNMMK